MASARPSSDQEHGFEVAISYLLRGGLIVSASIVLLGAAIYLSESGQAHLSYSTFRGEPASLRDIGRIARGARHLRSVAVMQFGLLLLIATPVARVLFSVFAFAKQRDRMYMVFTLIVLAILCYSLFSR